MNEYIRDLISVATVREDLPRVLLQIRMDGKLTDDGWQKLDSLIVDVFYEIVKLGKTSNE